MPGFAFPERVHRHSRPSGIKIIPVGGQRLGALDMDQFAEMAHLIRALQTTLIPGKPLHQIKLAVIQAVDLFRPDPQQIAQRAREAAEIAEIGLIDDTGPVGGHQVAAVGDKRLRPTGKAVAHHI